jgi:hypothetical protein
MRRISALAVLCNVLLLGTATSVLAPLVAASTSGSPVTAVVQGVLDCSNVLSTAGYGGSPAALALHSGSTSVSLIYPRRLRMPGENTIFGSPQLEKYRFKVSIPNGHTSTTVHWELSCQDKDGDPAGTQSGHFSLASRFSPSHPATRDICNHGGTVGLVLTICNPALSDKLGACAWEVLTDALGSEVLDAASLAADPPKTAVQYGEAALAEVTGTIGGLIIACAPIATGSSGGNGTSATTTTTTTPTGPSKTGGPEGWPVKRDDGSPAFFEYLGSDFIVPDWTSCDANYCLAGSDGTAYVFNVENGINQIGSVSESVADPAEALAQLGLPEADIVALLAPSG